MMLLARSSVRPAGRGPSMSPSPSRKPSASSSSWPGRAHGDRQRLAVDADLHRLFDGHLVGLAVALDDGDAAGGHQAVEHSERPDADDRVACRAWRGPQASCSPAGARRGWARPRPRWSGMARRCCAASSASWGVRSTARSSWSARRGRRCRQLPDGVEVVEDAREGRGPLQGLAAGLAAVRDPRRRGLRLVHGRAAPASALHPPRARRARRRRRRGAARRRRLPPSAGGRSTGPSSPTSSSA